MKQSKKSTGRLTGIINEEYDDESESEISELQELTLKTGMKPMAARADRFVNVGLNNVKRQKSIVIKKWGRKLFDLIEQKDYY